MNAKLQLLSRLSPDVAKGQQRHNRCEVSGDEECIASLAREIRMGNILSFISELILDMPQRFCEDGGDDIEDGVEERVDGINDRASRFHE